MLRYYEIKTAIRYYGPTAKDIRMEDGHVYATVGELIDGAPPWKDPHEYLANSDLGEWHADRIERYTRRFGPLSPRHVTASKDPIELGDEIRIDTGDFVGLQKLLRAAWVGDADALQEIAIGLTADLELEAKPNRLELVTHDLWTLIRLLFLRDRANGRAGVCANPDCSNPCFLESRRGQKYCCHRCAVLINVRRFRELHGDKTMKSRARRS